MARNSVTEAKREPTAGDRLLEICVVYGAINGLAQCLIDRCDDIPVNTCAEEVFGLALAIKALNDQVGKHAGAI